MEATFGFTHKSKVWIMAYYVFLFVSHAKIQAILKRMCCFSSFSSPLKNRFLIVWSSVRNIWGDLPTLSDSLRIRGASRSHHILPQFLNTHQFERIPWIRTFLLCFYSKKRPSLIKSRLKQQWRNGSVVLKSVKFCMEASSI